MDKTKTVFISIIRLSIALSLEFCLSLIPIEALFSCHRLKMVILIQYSDDKVIYNQLKRY